MSRPFGTHPDIHDHRDVIHEPPARLRRNPPRAVDLRAHCPPVYNQLHLNACSANAIAAALWFDEIADGRPDAAAPSRLFIYYNERAAEHILAKNAPVSLRDGYRSAYHFGTCPESRWPYRVHRFARRPTPRCYREALGLRVRSYARLRREASHLRACLAMGRPFTVAISVYESFMRPSVKKTGIIPLPRRGEKELGGHAVLIVGYAQRHFIVRNSWGIGWGMDGYGHMPVAYLEHPRLAWDLWTALRVGKARGRSG